MATPSRPGRWFAVILLQYNLRDPFWDRDAGLFYEGFKANGVDSRFVALGDPSIEQRPDLVLASQSQMEDPAWWRQWELEGVVLYSWALPRFTNITRALKDAGVKVVLVLDADGVRSPHVWFSRYLQTKYVYARMERRWFPWAIALAKTLGALPRSHYTQTLQHLELADRIGVPSPLGMQRFSRFLLGCGRADLVPRLALLHHPVASHMAYHPAVNKQPLIVAVGGWERLVKGAPLLVRALELALPRRPEYRARIIGSGREVIQRLVSRLPAGLQPRIEITGAIPNHQLSRHYQEARIFVNSSHSESFGIAAAEALCCGCSVVGTALIASFNYFCSEASGTLSCNRSPALFCDAICAEMAAWDSGMRDPARISATWTGRLHAKHVARAVVRMSEMT
jgi:glycosyltransferase involved in cell wall biosynthesis